MNKAERAIVFALKIARKHSGDRNIPALLEAMCNALSPSDTLRYVVGYDKEELYVDYSEIHPEDIGPYGVRDDSGVIRTITAKGVFPNPGGQNNRKIWGQARTLEEIS